MAVRTRRVIHVLNALAFAVTVVVGITVGCVCSAGEAIEEKLKRTSAASVREAPPR